MWALLKSVGNYIWNLFVSVGSIKFIIFTAIYWLMTKLGELVTALLGDKNWFTELPGKIAALPADFLFYLVLFRVDIGLPMILAAYVVAFAIRRLPIIG